MGMPLYFQMKSLIQRDSNSKCRNNILVLRTTPNIGANVLANFPINCENNIHQTLNPSTSSFHVPFTTESHPSRGFPSPNHPPRPRPHLFCASTAALASRSRAATASWPSRAAKCSGVSPREPRTRGGSRRAEPQRNEGEKNSEKILGTSKVESFGKLWPLKIIPGLKLTLYV